MCRNDRASVFQVTYAPPAQEGVCDVCGGELYQRDDDSEVTVSEAAGGLPHADRADFDYYKAQGLVVTISAMGPVDEVTGRALEGSSARSRSRTPCAAAVRLRAGRGCGVVPVSLSVSVVVRRFPGPRKAAAPMVQIKSPEQIAKMREAGLVVAAIHAATREAAVPGATTRDLDQVARKVLADHGAKPNFLGYGGFPATICTSVNEVVVHGIPSDEVVLKDGDIISVDCGAIIDGWHGDAAYTAFVGSGHAPELVELSRVTEESMWPASRP
ncbi:Methionine aminopeptidase 1, mitochondrial [Streptomyces fumanus]